jgi:hypothetical protein
VPLPAVSFIEGFRTPAPVYAASSRSAGIRNPQHERPIAGGLDESTYPPIATVSLRRRK